MKAIIFALALPLATPSFAAAPSPVSTAPSDEYVVEFDAAGTPLADFLKLTQGILGTQISFEPIMVKNSKLYAHGTTTVSKEGFRSFAEATLYHAGFLLVPIHSGLSLVNIRQPGSFNTASLRSSAKLVNPAEVGALAGRYVMVTTIVPISTLPAHEVANLLSSYMSEPSLEMVRSSGIGVVITGLADTVINATKIARAIEAEGAKRKSDNNERLVQLEQRVIKLEAAQRTRSK